MRCILTYYPTESVSNIVSNSTERIIKLILYKTLELILDINSPQDDFITLTFAQQENSLILPYSSQYNTSGFKSRALFNLKKKRKKITCTFITQLNECKKN